MRTISCYKMNNHAFAVITGNAENKNNINEYNTHLACTQDEQFCLLGDAVDPERYRIETQD